MEKWTPTARYCSNCGKKIIGYRNSEGMLKVQCQYCGVLYVSKRINIERYSAAQKVTSFSKEE